MSSDDLNVISQKSLLDRVSPELLELIAYVMLAGLALWLSWEVYVRLLRGRPPRKGGGR